MLRHLTRHWLSALALTLSLMLAACAAAPATTGDAGARVSATPGANLNPAQEGSASDGDFDQPEATEEPEAEEIAELPAIGAPDADESRSDDGSSASTGGGGAAGEVDPFAPFPTPAAQPIDPVVIPPDTQLQPLKAGEVNDNEDFAEFLQYQLDFKSFLGYPIHDLDVSERYMIRVVTENDRPVLGADVSIFAGQNPITSLHTPATGLVYFFPRAYEGTGSADDFTVIVERDQTEQEFEITRGENALYEVTLDVSPTQSPVALDVLFLIDSTGSMDDEIDELKNNILSISAQIAALPSQPDVRFGMVTYRDRGDSYVTKATEFTRNVQDFQQALNGINAAGGGDDPEALQEALAHALHSVDWRGGETVQLMFLVADAPPHLDYAQDYPYSQSLVEAAQMGIKIQPIASRLCEAGRSDCAGERRAYADQAEYIFRQIAQFTGGSFIFLTYDDTPQSSGEPGSDTHVDEQSYSVLDLDSLVVRLITDELAALNGGQ